MPSSRVPLIGVFIAASVFAQTSLTVIPQQVSLAAPAGSTTAAVQTLTVVATGQNTSFNASARYFGSAANWLSVSPAAGTTPAVITVSADASKLAAGTYFAQLTITAGTAGTYANVLLTVGSGSSAGTFVVNPSSLTFFGPGQPGAAGPSTQTIAVTNAKGVAGAIGFTALASSSGWLTVSPFPLATPANVTILADPAGLATGIYTGAITIIPVGGGNPTVVPVTLATTGTGNGASALTLSQTALTSNHQIGTPAPPLQEVDVVTIGASRQYTASSTTPWLQLVSSLNPTPSSSLTDATPGGFGVVINPAGLVPGTYVGTVTATASGLPPQQLPVTLTVGSQPALNANPSSISFDSTVGLIPVTVTVTSTGSANLPFTAAVAPGAAWLSVTPSSGSTGSGSTVLTIAADPTGLMGGVYTGTVILTGQGSGVTFSIPVRLNISGSSAAAGTLDISSKSVELTGVVGLPNPSQTISIGTSGTPHNFTAAASSTEGWLIVDPFSGTAPAKLTITANAAAVPGPGKYDGSVVITSLVTGAQDAIAVTFNLAQQAILAQPGSLTFAQQQRGVAPPPQTVQITANAPSTFTAKSASSWITVSPVTGSTPSAITVAVDPKGLPPGANSGSIDITGPNNQLKVPVSLTVLEPPGPNVTPSSIGFTYQLGSPTPPPQSISVGSTGEVVRFTAAATTESGVNWLTITPASGSTPAAVMASVNTALLVPGRQSGAIRIASLDGAVQRTVSVTLNVSATTVVVQGILHGATLAPTPVAPGQIVSITGTGLGPSTGVVARPTSAGAIESRLADIRVLFDGVPAPLLFVRNDQINAIVPYALYGRIASRVQVESAGTSFSIPIDAKVVDSAPGIFTLGSSGRGQAAALNADGSVNSLANPAQRGSVIALFGTGEGQTDPPGQDGRVIITDLRRPVLPVTATIGGRPVEVTYLGSAPMLVSGVFQANLRIPDDIDLGVLPVQIQVGGAVTQAGTTIVVR